MLRLAKAKLRCILHIGLNIAHSGQHIHRALHVLHHQQATAHNAATFPVVIIIHHMHGQGNIPGCHLVHIFIPLGLFHNYTSLINQS